MRRSFVAGKELFLAKKSSLPGKVIAFRKPYIGSHIQEVFFGSDLGLSLLSVFFTEGIKKFNRAVHLAVNHGRSTVKLPCIVYIESRR